MPIILVRLNATCIFSTGFRKIIKYHEKSVQWEPSLFQEDGLTDTQTDMTKLIVTFRSFANAPKNSCYRDVKQ